MKILHGVVLFTLIFVLVQRSEASKNNKYDSDFEFEDHEEKSVKKEGKKTWILDPTSDLCHVLKCKKKELCLLEDEFTAVCVNKKDINRNGDKIVPRSKLNKSKTTDDDAKDYDADDDLDSDYYDDDEYDDNSHDYFQDQQKKTTDRLTSQRTCAQCPMLTKPVVFLCGSDNRTYSSPCRLSYHNCVHRGNVSISCPGFCPCKVPVPTAATREEKLKLKKKQFDENSKANAPRFNKKYTFKMEETMKKGSDVKTFNGIPQPPQQSSLTQAQLNNQKYKDYYKPKKVSFEKVKSYNDVIKGNLDNNFECSAEALESIGNRLLDWFSVIMSDSKARKNKLKVFHKVNESAGCKSEVSWMFDHLNVDGDKLLSLHELFNIKNDHNEKCIKPFLDQCDTDGDLSINRAEWCSCFKKANPPCTAIKEQVTTGLLGGYIPQCDVTGFYKAVQCHSSIGLCWCVDKHGIEFPSTRTRGKPNCSSFSDGGDNGMDAEDDEDDDDTEGSGYERLDE